jgi:hypothetical protein
MPRRRVYKDARNVYIISNVRYVNLTRAFSPTAYVKRFLKRVIIERPKGAPPS